MSRAEQLINQVIEGSTPAINEGTRTSVIALAKRHGGVRAYEYARKGKELRMRPQPIHIFELDLVCFNLPELSLRIRCSKGTYIRSLVRDLGASLDSGAYLTALRRTGIGEFSVDTALSPEKFAETINNM